MRYLLLILLIISCNIEDNTDALNSGGSNPSTPITGSSSNSYSISIEDNSDGSGVKITNLTIYGATTLYALKRSESNGFDSIDSVSWSLSNSNAQITSSSGNSVTVVPTENSGSFTINATHPTLESVSVNVTIDNSTISGISGITAWYRADNFQSLNDGVEVTQWENIINNTNATATNGPTLIKNSVNGLPSLSFNGTNQSFDTNMLLSNAISSTAATVFAVFKVESIASNSSSFWYNDAVFADNGSNFGIFFKSAGPTVNINKCSGGASSCSAVNSFPITYNEFVLGTMKLNGATLTASINNGAESNATSGTGTNTNGNIYLGRSQSYYMDGDIAELIFFNTNISATDESNIEQYLCDKYALTCN